MDDNPKILESTKEFLEIKGFNVVACCTNGFDAVTMYEKYLPDLVFMDVIMPKYDGFYGLKNIKRINPDAKVVVFTSNSNVKILEKIVLCDPLEILTKPYPPERLIEVIQSIKNKSFVTKQLN